MAIRVRGYAVRYEPTCTSPPRLNTPPGARSVPRPLRVPPLMCTGPALSTWMPTRLTDPCLAIVIPPRPTVSVFSTYRVGSLEAPPIVRLRAESPRSVVTLCSPGIVMNASHVAVGTPSLQFLSVCQTPGPSAIQWVAPDRQYLRTASAAGAVMRIAVRVLATQTAM